MREGGHAEIGLVFVVIIAAIIIFAIVGFRWQQKNPISYDHGVLEPESALPG